MNKTPAPLGTRRDWLKLLAGTSAAAALGASALPAPASTTDLSATAPSTDPPLILAPGPIMEDLRIAVQSLFLAEKILDGIYNLPEEVYDKAEEVFGENFLRTDIFCTRTNAKIFAGLLQSQMEDRCGPITDIHDPVIWRIRRHKNAVHASYWPDIPGVESAILALARAAKATVRITSHYYQISPVDPVDDLDELAHGANDLVEFNIARLMNVTMFFKYSETLQLYETEAD